MYHVTINSLRMRSLFRKKMLKMFLVEAEFQDISVTEVDICIPFPNLDVYLRWLACSIHVGGYTQILDDLRDICQSKDLTSLYDDNGQILHKHEYIFAYCRK